MPHGWKFGEEGERFEVRVTGEPPVHLTFTAPGFVICSFVPRLFDFHDEAIPIPYAHSNVDSDEVIFYVDGNFMSRKGSGIEAGSLSTVIAP